MKISDRISQLAQEMESRILYGVMVNSIFKEMEIEIDKSLDECKKKNIRNYHWKNLIGNKYN